MKRTNIELVAEASNEIAAVTADGVIYPSLFPDNMDMERIRNAREKLNSLIARGTLEENNTI